MLCFAHRVFVLCFMLLTLLLVVALQVVKVLKQQGWTNDEILAAVGIKGGKGQDL